MKTVFIVILSVTYGVLLTTAHSRWKRHLDQLGSMIECRVGGGRWLSRLDYFDYGCYCGFGGHGRPLDAVDRCCWQHDLCYGKIESDGKCRWFEYPYWTQYSWSCHRGHSLTCSDPKNTCGREICKCDKQLVDCFSKASYDPELRSINKAEKCKP
ncbi:basic phospholipase A2 PA-12C-like [Stegostoma tigrinum]|uniref:basic phospholipase A2 PA-12C-like n=1 Tax=Stegostoma tigrinum TaxID=3053191 RepID=UPI00202AC551|nr:basic phospholipase A2 PA-12C-like [Stegostoma tigrinum]